MLVDTKSSLATTLASGSEPEELPRCEHCLPLRRDNNVLVLARLDDLRFISGINLVLALLSTMYLGLNVVLSVLNTYDNECFPCPEAATSEEAFHRLEFGGTFAFSLVGTLSLIFAPERRVGSEFLLKTLVFCNVGTTFVAATMVYMALERLEVTAHEIEYSNELTMACLDLLLVSKMLQVDGWRRKCFVGGSVVVAFGVATVQLAIYNLPLDWAGEQPAHALEFCFQAFCAAISFWFCMDNKLRADRMKRQIMLAPERLTVVIDELSRRAVHDHDADGYVPPTVARGATM